jgi:hypothetical protein
LPLLALGQSTAARLARRHRHCRHDALVQPRRDLAFNAPIFVSCSRRGQQRLRGGAFAVGGACHRASLPDLLCNQRLVQASAGLAWIAWAIHHGCGGDDAGCCFRAASLAPPPAT